VRERSLRILSMNAAASDGHCACRMPLTSSCWAVALSCGREDRYIWAINSRCMRGFTLPSALCARMFTRRTCPLIIPFYFSVLACFITYSVWLSNLSLSICFGREARTKMVDIMDIEDNRDYGANERILQPEDAYLSCEYHICR
jgi:hypothetical protein